MLCVKYHAASYVYAACDHVGTLCASGTMAIALGHMQGIPHCAWFACKGSWGFSAYPQAEAQAGRACQRHTCVGAYVQRCAGDELAVTVVVHVEVLSFGMKGVLPHCWGRARASWLCKASYSLG